MAWFNPKTRQAEVLKNAEGEEKTPSLVFFGDHEILVGKPAEDMLSDEQTNRFIYPPGAKRNIGKKIAMLLGNRTVTPMNVAVEVLRKLKQDAEELHFHTRVSHVVLTVPAIFDQLERERVRDASRIAGFKQIALLDEPVAAALAYSREGFQVGRHVLVYDLGAGTFDLALLSREGEQDTFDLALPPCGLRKGGDDFDRILYAHVDEKAKEEGRSVNNNGAMNLEILRQCRDRKENLSLRSDVQFSSILPDGRPFKHKLDRKTFEELISGIVAETVEQTDKLLQQARRDGHQIDTVLLVGGSSRVPLVSSMIQKKLTLKPDKWQHQDVAVALGAAYHAETIWGDRSCGRTQEAEGSKGTETERERQQVIAGIVGAVVEPRLQAICDRLTTFLILDRKRLADEQEAMDRAQHLGRISDYRTRLLTFKMQERLLEPNDISLLRALSEQLKLTQEEAASTEKQVFNGKTKEEMKKNIESSSGDQTKEEMKKPPVLSKPMPEKTSTPRNHGWKLPVGWGAVGLIAIGTLSRNGCLDWIMPKKNPPPILFPKPPTSRPNDPKR